MGLTEGSDFVSIENLETILKCPVCNMCLLKHEKQYICLNNHTYDIASKGYINLLLANQKNTKEPGDSKEMMEGRRDFLNSGYYQTFSEKLNQVIISNISGDSVNILDAGCGEGYFFNILIETNPHVLEKTSGYPLKDMHKELLIFFLNIDLVSISL